MKDILCPKCSSIASWDSYFQKYMCGTCNWSGKNPFLEQIEKDFNELIYTNVIVNKIWDLCKDDRLNNEDALKYMVVLLAQENKKLATKLMSYYAIHD